MFSFQQFIVVQCFYAVNTEYTAYLSMFSLYNLYQSIKPIKFIRHTHIISKQQVNIIYYIII